MLSRDAQWVLKLKLKEMQGNDCNKCQDSVTFWAREEIVIRIGHTEGLFGWLAGKVFPDLSAITTVSLLLIIYCHPLL